MQDENLYKGLEELAKKKNLEIYKISAATKQGIKELMKRIFEILKTLPKEDLIEIEKEPKIYTLEQTEDITVKKEDGIYIVSGRVIELGVNEKLKQLGIKDGDTVQISDWELEWEE